jgi:hypothetical protein
MRLKSAIWVSAFLRRHQVEGRYGAVIRKGAEEAGAVYVIVNHLDGTMHVFGPAPGPAYDDKGERRFALELGGPVDAASVDSLLARRRAADPDIWVVEIEDRVGNAGLVAIA